MARFIGKLILLVSLTVGTNAFADFKAYSRDNQYLGIVFSAGSTVPICQASSWTIMEGPIIYNQSLDAMIGFITSWEGCDTMPQIPSTIDIPISTFFYSSTDCTGTMYSSGLLSKHSNGKYYKPNGAIQSLSYQSISSGLSGTCMNTNGTTFAYQSSEVTSIPFSVPIQVPFRYEYITPSVQTKTVVIPLSN